jgi:hypothetical protein
MVSVFQFFRTSNELLAKTPEAAEVGATLDLFDRA